MSNEVKFRSVVLWHHNTVSRGVVGTSYLITAYTGEWGKEDCRVIASAQARTPEAAGQLLRDWKEFFQHFVEIQHRDV